MKTIKDWRDMVPGQRIHYCAEEGFDTSDRVDFFHKGDIMKA